MMIMVFAIANIFGAPPYEISQWQPSPFPKTAVFDSAGKQHSTEEFYTTGQDYFFPEPPPMACYSGPCAAWVYGD